MESERQKTYDMIPHPPPMILNLKFANSLVDVQVDRSSTATKNPLQRSDVGSARRKFFPISPSPRRSQL